MDKLRSIAILLSDIAFELQSDRSTKLTRIGTSTVRANVISAPMVFPSIVMSSGPPLWQLLSVRVVTLRTPVLTRLPSISLRLTLLLMLVTCTCITPVYVNDAPSVTGRTILGKRDVVPVTLTDD